MNRDTTSIIAITLRKSTIKDLNEVSKRLGSNRSRIIQEFLDEFLPVLLESTPNQVIKTAIAKMSKSLNDIGDLFDDENTKK